MDIIASDIALDQRGDFLVTDNGIETVTGDALVIQYLKTLLRSDPGDISAAPAFGLGLKDLASLPNTRQVADILKEEMTDAFQTLPGAELYTIVPSIYPTGARSIAVELSIFTPEGNNLVFDFGLDYATGRITGFGQPDISVDDPYLSSSRTLSEVYVPTQDTTSVRLKYSPAIVDQIYVVKIEDLESKGYDSGYFLNVTKPTSTTITGLASTTIDMSTYLTEDQLDGTIGQWRPVVVVDDDTGNQVDYSFDIITKVITIFDTVTNITITGEYEDIYCRATDSTTTSIEPEPTSIRPYMRNFAINNITVSKTLEKNVRYLIQYTTLLTK